ncbi:MAG: hypothetical protein NT136_04245 [Candidatus Moranbacteria bacterium]|nr:hypothetical protein [Candidatus Moranbacteria bacterium]
MAKGKGGKMSGKIITKNMKIGEIIAFKDERAKKIIEDYFFDFKNLPLYAKKITLEEAARKSGKDYKILAVLRAINNLPEKKKK